MRMKSNEEFVEDFYASIKPIDFSKGTVVDRFMARKMHMPLSEVVEKSYMRLLLVDLYVMDYLEGKIPDKDTGKYIWENPEDLEWYKMEKEEEE